MAIKRGDKLREEISLLEDSILYSESKGVKDLDEAKKLLARVKRLFEQGTWSAAERELSRSENVKNSLWYLEFIKKREEEGTKTQEISGEPRRFKGDGLCGKYGHLMVKVRLSNVRWYYQCRLCKKRGKSQSIYEKR
ncbi:MAG: hypothetical protein JSW00_02980 [Thermoplasmata archaeon]|nr:MAG: hypothetical protein JSW00_02980 [Thermoplasmata archaeon]